MLKRLDNWPAPTKRKAPKPLANEEDKVKLQVMHSLNGKQQHKNLFFVLDSNKRRRADSRNPMAEYEDRFEIDCIRWRPLSDLVAQLRRKSRLLGRTPNTEDLR